MRNWEDVLPPDVAKRQHSWERSMAAVRMRRLGMPLHQVGMRLGVCTERARQIAEFGERMLRYQHESPIEEYMGGDDVWNEPRPNSLWKGLRNVIKVLDEVKPRVRVKMGRLVA